MPRDENVNRKIYLLDRLSTASASFLEENSPKMELSCAVQNYAWGKPGNASEVALLQSSANSDFKIDESKPYAELWMGTHPNGPSVLTGSGALSLKEHISNNKSFLGEQSRARFGDDLPFLFKVNGLIARQSRFGTCDSILTTVDSIRTRALNRILTEWSKMQNLATYSYPSIVCLSDK